MFHGAKRSALFFVTFLVMFILFTSCAQPTLTPFPTPNIPNWGSTPAPAPNPEWVLQMPETLSCILVPHVPPAEGQVSWKGIRIGVSTFDDVQQALAPEEGDHFAWDTVRGNMSFWGSWDKYRWTDVGTCFEDNKLSAMNISIAKEFLKPISDYVSNYGKPDVVTWGNRYYERSLIWAEKGLLVVAGDSEDTTKTSTHRTILFSPVPRCDLSKSWIYLSLPTEKSLYSGNVAIDMPNEIKDPWGIEKGLDNCPK